MTVPGRNFSLAIATLTFATSACQCLNTVDDQDGGKGGGGATGGGAVGGGTGGALGGGTGGGVAGGSGGGTGGGSTFNDGGCATYLDCSSTGSEGNVTWCGGVEGSSSYSCIDGRCLWECHGHRICTEDAGCENCTTPVSNACNPGGCAVSTTSCTGTVEQSTCGAFLNESFRYSTDANCTQTFTLCDGGMLGSWTPSDGSHETGELGNFGECTIEVLPTNAIRWVVNCPGCQLALSF